MRAGISSENSSSNRSGIQGPLLQILAPQDRCSLARRGEKASQLQMAVVTNRRSLRTFAGAQQSSAVALDLPLQRLDAGALVRAIAERLALRAPAAAPPIGLAGDELDEDRLAAADFRFAAHVAPPPPASVARQASPQALASSRTRRI